MSPAFPFARVLGRTALLLPACLFIAFLGWNWFCGTGDQWASGGPKGGDLAQHYAAAHFWNEGNYTGLYRGFQLGDWMNGWYRDSGLNAKPTMARFNYIYSPFIAWTSAQLDGLSYSSWLRSWAVFNILCYLAAFAVLLRAFPLLRTHRFTWFWVWIGFPSFYFNFIPLQNVTLTLLILASAAWVRNLHRPLFAGLILGCTFYKPQIGPFFLLFFLLAREWRIAAGIALSGAFWGLLGLAVCGWESHRLWLEALRDMSSGLQYQVDSLNISLRGALLSCLPSGTSRTALDLAGSLLGLVILVLTALAGRKRVLASAMEPGALIFLAVIPWLLASPYTSYYELLLALPWCLLVIAPRWPESRSVALLVSFFLLSFLTLLGTATTFAPVGFVILLWAVFSWKKSRLATA